MYAQVQIINCVQSLYLDQLPVGQDSEEELLVAAAQVDCSDTEEDLSECSISRKGSCPLRNIIHLNCICKHDPTAMHS